MRTVFLDTSYKTMSVACIQDNKVVSFFHEEAFKRQSEMAMSVLDDCVKEAGWNPMEIDEMVVAIGPGSYTGVRIAMTIAKTLAAISNIKVKTITSLELFVDSNDDTCVLFDAKSERAYVGLFKGTKYTQGPLVLSVEEIVDLIRDHNYIIKGDGHLIGKEDSFKFEKETCLRLIKNATPIEDVDHLSPLYLKEMMEY